MAPITHLTVRLDCETWSRWHAYPQSPPSLLLDDALQGLGLAELSELLARREDEEDKEASIEIALEPGWKNIDGRNRPCASQMVQAAKERHADYASESWGARIGTL